MAVLMLAMLSISGAPATERARARSWASSMGKGTVDDRPNLLLIIADDHGGLTMGIQGDPRRATPNLDALAREGILFERAYCNAPLCTPSRQSLITGKLPHATGVMQLTNRLSDDILTMGEWFTRLGYRTAAIGKMHFNGPSNHGFAIRIDTNEWEAHLRAHPPEDGDQRPPWRPFQVPAAVWLNSDRHSDGLPAHSMQSSFLVDRALELLAKPADGPFAMVVSLYDPHSPFRFPRGWENRFRPEQFPVHPISDSDRLEQPRIFAGLTPAQTQGIQASYYTSLAFADEQIGRLVRGLDAAGLGRKTLVVYVGDNGYMLGHRGRFEKHCLYEPAVRIPMIFRWTGTIPADRRSRELAEMVDVLPTTLDLLKLPAPAGLHGLDLSPIVRGKAGAVGHDAVFSEYNENEEAMVRTRRFKLIVGTGTRVRQDGYRTGRPLPGPYVRLYDELDDPEETRDLADHPHYQSIRDDLLDRLYRRLTTTREGLDPLPSGLDRMEAIRWCLPPRVRRSGPGVR